MATVSMDEMSLDDQPEGLISMLNIDVLLIIFNYLSLYDKLMAMRVNKRWCHILKSHQSWTVINFNDKGPIRKVNESARRYRRFVSKDNKTRFVYQEFGNEWQFPTNEWDELNFLNLYAGASLEEIYLTVVSEKIMTFLRLNCPRLRTLDFVETKDLHEKLYLPPKLQSLGINYPWGVRNVYKGLRCERLISCLEKCSHLRKLTLRNIPITSQVMKVLAGMTSLHVFELFDSRTKCRSSDFPSSSIGSLISLTSFRLVRSSFINTADKLLYSIRHWSHLKHLAIIYAGCSSESIEKMIPELLNLETLELEGLSVTLSVVTLIGTHLKKLKSLELGSGNYDGSSLLSLRYHATLENFVVDQSRQCNENNSLWLGLLCDVLITLPRIKNVKITSLCRPIRFSVDLNTYPIIRSADIELVYYDDIGLYSWGTQGERGGCSRKNIAKDNELSRRCFAEEK
ncbi:uncharacterized protein [Amphiura filiformis]|uniref:uncharacterized protein n=1 Tax=Amphiura filiformis TaxID=82378 RepID=UPI003B2276E5